MARVPSYHSLGRPGRHHHELLCGIRLTARLFFIPSGVSSLIVQEVCNCSWLPSVKVFNEVCGSSLYSVYLFDVFFKRGSQTELAYSMRPHKGFVGCLFHSLGATAQVSLEKSEWSIGLHDFVIYMLAPIEVSRQFYA